MKKKILYYSDCFFFAGCENMIANFMNSKELQEQFDVYFVYRYSERYWEGAKTRIGDMSRCEGVKLLTEPDKNIFVTSSVRLIALLQKGIWAIAFLINKYYSIIKNAKTLQKVFSQYSPDIIHVNNGGYPAATSAQAAVIAAHRCGVKDIYYVVNNMALDYSHPLRWIDAFLDPFIKKNVTKFITGSNNAGIHLKKVLGLPNSKQITIRNGIVRRYNKMSKAEFKKAYSIPKEKVIFSTIANLEERKGHKYLLQAIKDLKDENQLSNYCFILEGKGPEEAFIRDYIINNGLSNYVKLISVPSIYDLYSATDVTILPSIANEDFPNIIIESMGMGIPVIGTRIAGIPEQIIPEETGLLIEPADRVALKKAIERLGTDSEFRRECGKRAQEVFKANYTASRSINNYISLYNKE